MGGLVKVDSISKDFLSNGYHLKVLEDISLSVEPSEVVAIVGQSGTGKTTLLNIISGLEKPSSGYVYTDGSIGYIPQKDMLLPWRTVIENLLLPIEIKNGDIRQSALKAKKLLDKNNLGRFSRSYPSEISGGMKQKISLIRTLLLDPDIILFDEPFSAIDFNARLQLIKEMRTYLTSNNKAAIFVTHNIEEAISIADKLIVLSNSPAKIAYQTKIDIPNSLRDPVNIRKSKNFQELFEKIWKLIS